MGGSTILGSLVRRLNQRWLFRHLSPWSASLLLHSTIMLALALLSFVPTTRRTTAVIETRITRPRQAPEFLQLAPELTTASNTLSVVNTTVRGAPGNSGDGNATELKSIRSRPVDESMLPETYVRAADGIMNLPGRTDLDLGVKVKGDPLAEADTIAQAMDRLTMEILRMLRDGKVLAVWLFDESQSMKDEQLEIRERFERVYDELGISGKAEGDALLTAVTSFGAGLNFHTAKPTSDRDIIRSAIDSIPVDPSGRENVLGAILGVAKQYSRFFTQGNRQVALIILTDESGDDTPLLEETLRAVVKIRAPVYVLGRQAIFGYPLARLVWRHEQTGRVFHPVINRGPESADVECLQYNGFYERWDEHSSGFGPFDLIRLARDSGGIYFMLPSEELYVKEQRYNVDDLREYLPEYVSREEYTQRRGQSPLRSALYEVIQSTKDFRLRSRFGGMRFAMRRDRFVPAARKALEQTRQYRFALENHYLRLTELEPYRRLETSRRWRAQFDLITAQVLAYTVKMVDYEAILSYLLKENPPPKGPADPERPRNNHWAIHPSRNAQFAQDEAAQLRWAKARALLNAVIERHPATPWEHRAGWELERGLGLALREYYVNPNPPPRRRPTRPAPKIVVPKF